MTKTFFKALAAIALLALSACTQDEINQFLNSVNSIELDQTQVEMTVGETLHLFATVDPFNGDTKVVTWTSSSPDVASVKGTEIPDVTGINMPAGEVTALKEGETTITAKAGDKSATCKVIVKKKADDGGGGNTDAVTELKLDKAEVHMSPGQVWQLNATVKPEGASISWSSNKTDVATVDGEGKVTAIALGEAVITASAGEKSAQCLVKVEKEVAIEGISIIVAPSVWTGLSRC